jgi:hypothetical protein
VKSKGQMQSVELVTSLIRITAAMIALVIITISGDSLDHPTRSMRFAGAIIGTIGVTISFVTDIRPYRKM